MKKVFNLKTKITEKISNTYLIQILKSYFINSLILKNNYLLGMKSNTITHLSGKKNSDVQAIDYDNVKWILMISKTIPDESLLPRDKIVRVAVCDLVDDVFLIDNLK